MKKLYVFVILFLIFFSCNSQEKKDKKKFEIINEVKTTSVKNQGRSGTCWSFATCSFVETEALRMGKGEHDLSEIYIVRHCYFDKAQKFIRLHGKSNFSEGGQAHDFVNVSVNYGLVPEQIYKGLNDGSKIHNHTEMFDILDASLKSIIKKRKITNKWKELTNSILDIYLGKIPEKFIYENKEYTPLSFMNEVIAFNPDDYVELTSYSHHKFYEKFNLEIPDNWSDNYYYNLPIDDLMRVFYYALENNFSIDWDGDVSEKKFEHAKELLI